MLAGDTNNGFSSPSRLDVQIVKHDQPWASVVLFSANLIASLEQIGALIDYGTYLGDH